MLSRGLALTRADANKKATELVRAELLFAELGNKTFDPSASYLISKAALKQGGVHLMEDPGGAEIMWEGWVITPKNNSLAVTRSTTQYHWRYAVLSRRRLYVSNIYGQ
jgi:hypothetical protein